MTRRRGVLRIVGAARVCAMRARRLARMCAMRIVRRARARARDRTTRADVLARARGAFGPRTSDAIGLVGGWCSTTP